ncbi:MAG: choice-of-anchor Q domain-containing protein [Terriglobales bacterium]
MSKAVRFGLLTLIILGTTLAIAQVAPPEIFFTDLSSAPNSGGESVSGFAGAYVTLYGNGFGTTQGSSTVNWNGQNCLRVVSWGGTWLWYQKVVVQLGSSCTAGTGSFVVTVNGQASTSPSQTINGYSYTGATFTVRSTGHIYCVATSGSDSNAGTFSGGCWATMLKAKNTVAAGDVAYVENGVNQSTMDPLSSSYSQPASLSFQTGDSCGGVVPCAQAPLAMGAYPGATATVTACSGCGYIWRVPNISGNMDNWTLFGLTFRGPGIDIGGPQPTSWRMVANDISCNANAPVYGCITNADTNNYWWYGNWWHDVGADCNGNGLGCKLYHAFYTATSHVDFGWNIVDPDTANTGTAGCRGVQWHTTLTTTDDGDLRIHDNIIRNAICDGLNLATNNSTMAGGIQVYNNVFYHDGKGPDPSGDLSEYTCIYGGGSNNNSYTTPVYIYNNSFFDCGSRGEDNGAFAFTSALPAALYNNIIQQSSSEPYFASGDAGCSNWSGTNNDWYGSGGAPCTSSITASLNSNPNFTSAAAGSSTNSLQILSGSPAAGAGTTSHVPVYDINGLVRPSPPSLGAYELASAATVTRPNPPTNVQVSVQ